MLFAADNIQITRKIVADALNSFNPGPIQEIVRACEKHGADIIDINSGHLGKNAVEKMMFFVHAW